MVDERWIADGCAEAARFRAAGNSDLAARVLAYVERRALGCRICGGATHHPRAAYCSPACKRRGSTAHATAWRRKQGCSVASCSNQRHSRTLCQRHLGLLRAGRLTRWCA